MKVRTRVAAIVVKNKKVLLVKGKNLDDLWTPGGGIDGCESDEQCLKRELKEELNVDLVSMKPYKEYLRESPYHNHLTKCRLYLADIKGDPRPGREIGDFVWYSRDDFVNKKYSMVPVNQEEVIPDLIGSDLI